MNTYRNRNFLVRAVRHAAEQGVEQFIDIGTGIPTSPNVHEVARSVVASLHFVEDREDPHGSVAFFRELMLPGSCLIVSHITGDGSDPAAVSAIQQAYKDAAAPAVFRTAREDTRLLLASQVARFVDSHDQEAADEMRRRHSEPDGSDVEDRITQDLRTATSPSEHQSLGH